MPARKVPLVNNQFYHVYNRGINKQPIFREIKDYRRAIELIKFYQYSHPPLRYSKYQLLSLDRKQEFWKITAKTSKLISINSYCLMPNHFHLLAEQKTDNGISKYLSNLQNSYTKYFNTKHNRTGPLLQGQFKAVRIEDDNQLLHVNRYIHLNPYSSFIVKSIDDILAYPWSSIQEYLKTTINPICEKGIILSNFKNINEYKSFILEQADYQRQLDAIKHLIFEEV